MSITQQLGDNVTSWEVFTNNNQIEFTDLVARAWYDIRVYSIGLENRRNPVSSPLIRAQTGNLNNNACLLLLALPYNRILTTPTSVFFSCLKKNVLHYILRDRGSIVACSIHFETSSCLIKFNAKMRCSLMYFWKSMA